MSKNYGLGYLGSKSGIAPWVVEHLPSTHTLVDIFAGGCAITHAAILAGKWDTIIANDITDTPRLFLDAISGKYRDEVRWISREDFETLKDSDAYVRCCWSFGNNGQMYLYSKKIEPYKRACHYAVVLDEWGPLQELCPEVWQAARAAMKGCKTIHQRRLKFGPAIVRKLKELRDPSLLDKNPLYASCHRKITKGTNPDATYLESLQSLERPKTRLFVSQADYKAVDIPDGAVIYCDPPYKGTAEYSVPFDSEAFYEWARSSKHPVFFSEYSAPADFRRVAATRKSVTLNTTNNFSFEFLFWNGK